MEDSIINSVLSCMGAKDTLQKSEDSITCCLACAAIDKIIDVAIVEQ